VRIFSLFSGGWVAEFVVSERVSEYSKYHFPTYAVQFEVICGSTNILSAEICGSLAEGLRFDCGQYGSFAVFAEVYLRCHSFIHFRSFIYLLSK